MTTHQRASRAEIAQKCTGGRGSAADPTGELTTLPQTHYSSIKGPYLRGENGGERMERNVRGGKGRGSGTPSLESGVTRTARSPLEVRRRDRLLVPALVTCDSDSAWQTGEWVQSVILPTS